MALLGAIPPEIARLDRSQHQRAVLAPSASPPWRSSSVRTAPHRGRDLSRSSAPAADRGPTGDPTRAPCAVVAETALAVVLLTGAVLLVTFAELRGTDRLPQ
jgi:hypothetical protein